MSSDDGLLQVGQSFSRFSIVEDKLSPIVAGLPENIDHHGEDHCRYWLTMELAAVGIAHVGLDGRYLEVNAAICELLGYSREELLAMSVWDTSHPDDLTMTSEVRAQLHRGEIDSFTREKRYVHKDGHTIWVQIDIAVCRDEAGEVLYDISVFQDISARRQTEALLVQAQKLEATGQLAAGIAHEINTPMQYVGDNTHFMKLALDRLLAVAQAAEAVVGEGATEADRDQLVEALSQSKLPMLAKRAPKAADDALSGVENVSRIVSAMKRFSHPGSEDMVHVDVNESLMTAITVSRNEWKYSAELETDLDPDLPPILGNLGSLNQVWLNMIVNAAHAIADRHGANMGQITVTTSTVDGGDTVLVSIIDNGAGIAEEHRHRIFEQFFTTKEVGRGTGQGLSIAYQIVAGEHNGHIDIESTLGEGTTFLIRLPTKQPAEGADGAG
jgi:PAS domain S-box-containing protein